MAASGRKYSDEQIRFVLTRWSTVKRAEIAAQYCAKYGKDPKDFTEKHAKYIKDAYAGNPRWVQEFGHLRSDRQLQNARLKEQAKQTPSISASQRNLPFQQAKAASTPPDISDMQAAPSSTLGGVTGGSYLPAGSFNGVGLGLLNTPVSRPTPSPMLLTQPISPLPSSPTPASFIKASLPPRNIESTAAGIGYQGNHPGFSAPGTPRQSAGMTTSQHFMSPSLPSAFNQAQSTVPSQPLVRPTASPQVPSPVQAGQVKAKSSPNVSTPPSHIQLPTGDFDKDGVWYNARHDGCHIHGRHRHNNDGTILSSSMKSPIQGLQGATPPSHIRLPTGDFDKDGVWYSASHDGCQIHGRHRHNNDGTILSSTLKSPIQRVQGTKHRMESISPNMSNLDRLPKEILQVSAQPPLDQARQWLDRHLNQPPKPSSLDNLPKEILQVSAQPQLDQARQWLEGHANQPPQLGSSFQPRGTKVVQPAKEPSITIRPIPSTSDQAQRQQSSRQNVNHLPQLGSPFQTRSNIVVQPPKKPSTTIPPISSTSAQVQGQHSPRRNVNQPPQLGSPFQAQNTITVQPTKRPIPSTLTQAQGQHSPRRNMNQSGQLGSPFEARNIITVQPTKGPISSTSDRAQQPHNQHVTQSAQLGGPSQPHNTAGFQPVKEHGVAIPPTSSMPDHTQQPPNQHVSQPAQLGSSFQPRSTIVAQPSTEMSVTNPPGLSTLPPATVIVRAEQRAHRQSDIADSESSTFLQLLESSSPIPVSPMEPDLPPITNTNYDTFYRLPDTHNGAHFQESLYNTFADYPWTEPMGYGESPIVDVPSRNDHNNDMTNSREGSDGDRVTADIALNTLGHRALQQSMRDSEGEPLAKKIKR